MLLFLVSSQPYCSKKVVILSKQSIDSKYKYFHGFVQFRINVNLHFCALIFVNTMLTKLLLEIDALISHPFLVPNSVFIHCEKATKFEKNLPLDFEIDK